MKLSTGLEVVLVVAEKEASRRKHEYIQLEHVLAALLADPEIENGIGERGGDLDLLKSKTHEYLDRQTMARRWSTPEGVPLGTAPGSVPTTVSVQVERLIRHAAAQRALEGGVEVRCEDVFDMLSHCSGSVAEHLLKDVLVHIGPLGEKTWAKVEGLPVDEETGRPDFASFAKALRGEARWSAKLYDRAGTSSEHDKNQAASDQGTLNALADHVEMVGKKLGFL